MLRKVKYAVKITDLALSLKKTAVLVNFLQEIFEKTKINLFEKAKTKFSFPP
jgi:hypothetical protein